MRTRRPQVWAGSPEKTRTALLEGIADNEPPFSDCLVLCSFLVNEEPGRERMPVNSTHNPHEFGFISVVLEETIGVNFSLLFS